MADINWRPGRAWPAVCKKLNRRNCADVILLIEDRKYGLRLEKAYWVGDALILSRPLDTFLTPLCESSGWRRFAVVRVHRPPRPRKE